MRSAHIDCMCGESLAKPALAEVLRDCILTPGVEAPGVEIDAMAHDLEAALQDSVRAARAAWPTIALPAEVFVGYLGARLPAGVPALVALHRLHTADLYLACACARRDAHAFAVFDAVCLRRLDDVLRKLGSDDDTTAEIKQEIRCRVLIGDGDRAEIVDFSGRGDLRGWVRVMAVRLALQRKRRAHREVSLDDDEQLRRIAAPDNTQLDYTKGVCRREFERAFQAALQALSDRERTMLRQHYVDAVTVDELGALYRVHRSTAARLVARARHALLAALRAQLGAQLEVSPGDLDSIIRLIRSQIEISWRAAARPQAR